jgi:hypothetical protein
VLHGGGGGLAATEHMEQVRNGDHLALAGGCFNLLMALSMRFLSSLVQVVK